MHEGTGIRAGMHGALVGAACCYWPVVLAWEPREQLAVSE